ncbi:MAG TPA: hypothetical protein VK723_04310 [Thermoplasmata archaeon]|nr:hypothetical protein [Thermoplasmata archaeon]
MVASESPTWFVPTVERFWPPGLLAGGSALLLVAPLVWLTRQETGAFRFMTPLAVFIHLIAWVGVLGGAKTDGTRVAGWASVIGFAAGLLTLPQAFPETVYGMIDRPLWMVILPFFPYIPSVFGPVVVAHAAYFVVDRRDWGAPFTPRFLSGVALLLIVSGTALGLQLTGRFGGVAYLAAGLTSPGYALVAWDALREPSPSRVDGSESGDDGGIPEETDAPLSGGQHA